MEEKRRRILEIRHESPEKELSLCMELLNGASKEDYATQAFAKTYLADALQSLGRLDEAYKESKEALEILHKCDDKQDELYMVLYNLIGIICTGLLDEQGALDYFFRGMNQAREKKDLMMQSAFLANISNIYKKAKAYQKAQETLDEAFSIARSAEKNEQNVAFEKTFYYIQKAKIAIEAEETDSALHFLHRVEQNEDMHDSKIKEELSLYYAVIYAKKKEFDKAKEYIEYILPFAKKEENRYIKLTFYNGIIESYLAMEQYTEASRFLGECHEILENMNGAGRWLKLAEYEILIYENLKMPDQLKEAYALYCEDDMQLSEARKRAKIKRLKKRIELEKEFDKRANIQARQSELSNKSEYDALTGVFNRRGIQTHMEMAYEKARAQKKSYGVVIVDVDYFKEFNDTYGHVAGDHCLKRVTKVLSKNIEQGSDMIGRYGGDEILLTFTGRTKSDVEAVLEKIMEDIKEEKIQNIGAKTGRYLTVTMGGAIASKIAEGSDSADDVQGFWEFVKQADAVLYQVKEQGRNAFCVKQME